MLFAPAIALALALAAEDRPPVTTSSGPRAGVASVPTAAFAPDGTLWAAWVEDGHVFAGSSLDLGKTFSAVARVSPDGEAIDANGEARPKIAPGPTGEVYVSYTRKGRQPFTGDIRLSRRLPDGSFSPPLTVNDDGLPTGHRFEALGVSPRGDVQLVWIDKRDLERAKAAGLPYEGAALYSAASTDQGRTFSTNRKVKDGVCECCRLAVAWDGDAPVVLWRDILAGGVRDHALARLDGNGIPTTQRVTDDGWKIDGCPHHGPALAIGSEGTWHVAWFTGAGQRGAGAFYRRSADRGAHFSEPLRLGSARAGRPSLAALGGRVWVAWKETEGDSTAVRLASSRDAGITWTEPRPLARTDGASDHPMLVARGADVFLSWFTASEGYQVVPVD